MSLVRIDSASIERQIQQCQNLVHETEAQRKLLLKQYQQAGQSWHDRNFQALGGIINSCCNTLHRFIIEMQEAIDGLRKIQRAIDDYESTNLLSDGGDISTENTTYSGQGDIRNCPVEGGYWTGARGNSMWIPDRNAVPQKSNPENKTWGEILDQFQIEGIQFFDGEPDFSPVSVPGVRISSFVAYRPANYANADSEQAQVWNCSRTDVCRWRQNNHYTWHEGRNREDMQLVPTIIHSNITHRAGYSEARSEVIRNLASFWAYISLLGR